MRTLIFLGALAVVALPLTTGCHMFAHMNKDCVCAAGKAGDTVWCEPCSEGFMDAKIVTRCKGCFESKNGGAACTDCAKE